MRICGCKLSVISIKWQIGDGFSVKFWTDPWLTVDVRLLDVAVSPVLTDMHDTYVASFVTKSGGWRWDLFHHLLPPSVCLTIAGFHPPSLHLGKDKIVWGHESNGKFSSSSAYRRLRVSSSSSNQDTLWSTVWHWHGPQRIRAFMWLVAHDALLTNWKRCYRHLASDSSCARCGMPIESALHVLRDCPHARRIWEKCHTSRFISDFYHLNLLAWLQQNL
ncbi:hypothetical protein K2173_000789 [Erythroxylum novogranatense]|uniref:Reverse transcriptase zinc-binding domain-containing protein n=1 Tax=Erythroxylum novogranatense TaxID=1862640 RepID=A0AAV8T2X3_9ROSI|nr:hypothetical protein K2173_000789 [Erythroxylum novogranatense]